MVFPAPSAGDTMTSPNSHPGLVAIFELVTRSASVMHWPPPGSRGHSSRPKRTDVSKDLVTPSIAVIAWYHFELLYAGASTGVSPSGVLCIDSVRSRTIRTSGGSQAWPPVSVSPPWVVVPPSVAAAVVPSEVGPPVVIPPLALIPPVGLVPVPSVPVAPSPVRAPVELELPCVLVALVEPRPPSSLQAANAATSQSPLITLLSTQNILSPPPHSTWCSTHHRRVDARRMEVRPQPPGETTLQRSAVVRNMGAPMGILTARAARRAAP